MLAAVARCATDCNTAAAAVDVRVRRGASRIALRKSSMEKNQLTVK